MSKKKVEEQKGPINCRIPTYRTMIYPDRVKEREAECMLRRSAQTLTLHEPKQ